MELKNLSKILLIKQRDIGDLLLTVPVANAVKEKFPDSYVAILVNSGTEEVVTQNPSIDKVYVFDRSSKKEPFIKKIINQIKFVWEIRKEKFDLVVNFTGGDRGALCALASGAKYKIAYNYDKGGFPGKKYVYTHRTVYNFSPRHEVERNMDLLRPYGIDTANKSPRFFFSEDDGDFISNLFNKNNIKNEDLKIHIHPTSKWLFKCWKDERFAQIIDYLIEKHKAKVIVTAGISGKELKKAENILSLCKNKPLSLVGAGLTLKQLAALSNKSNLFVGVDTGPMHIAASVSTPVVVLFGPSDPVYWAPWGDNHEVVKSAEFDCMPCNNDGCDGSKRSKCLEAITVNMVQEKIDSVILRNFLPQRR